MSKKIRIIPLFLLFTLFTLSSCVTGFKVTGDKSNIKGQTLAVIAGLKNEESFLFAQHLTEELQKNSNFKVLSQEQIKSKLSIYPDNIKGPYAKFSIEKIVEDYNNTDLNKIKDIQNKLGVDNILIIWAPIHLKNTGDGYTGDIYEIHSINQFFSFPGCKEVGRGKFKAGYASGFVIGVKVKRNLNDGIKQGSEMLAKNIVKETNMLKQN